MVSGLVSTILVLVPVISLSRLPQNAPGFIRLMLGAIPLLILGGALPFLVRGYRIESRSLCIRRLGWWTRLDLRGLKSAEADPGAMKASIRLFGNGGLFSFTGWYWNRRLGRYRAFITDPARSVVLRFEDRTVVVSPDSPDDFVRSLEK